MSRFATLDRSGAPTTKPKLSVESTPMWEWRKLPPWWDRPSYLEMAATTMDKRERMAVASETLIAPGA